MNETSILALVCIIGLFGLGIWVGYMFKAEDVAIFNGSVVTETCRFDLTDGQVGLNPRIWNLSAQGSKSECQYLQKACETGLFAQAHPGVCKWIDSEKTCECRYQGLQPEVIT